METKKSEKANVEKTKSLFFLVGLILTLSATLMAFEWKSYEKENIFKDLIVDDIPDIPIIDNIINPEPPKPQKPITIFNIVKNDVISITNLDSLIFDIDDTTTSTYLPIELPQEKNHPDIEIIDFPDENPDFVGGDEERINFISKNIKYPNIAIDNVIEGRVILTFIVEKNGTITDIKVLKDIGGGCGEEAARVAKLMPKWKPGKVKGKTVRTRFNMPIMFQLN